MLVPNQPSPTRSPLLDLGRDCLARRDHAGALSAFEELLRHAPEAVEALVGRGEALFALDRFVESVETFSRALTHSPNEPRLLIGRARAHFENNDNENALADCETVLHAHPEHVDAIAYRGASLPCVFGEPDCVSAWREASWASQVA